MDQQKKNILRVSHRLFLEVQEAWLNRNSCWRMYIPEDDLSSHWQESSLKLRNQRGKCQEKYLYRMRDRGNDMHGWHEHWVRK